MKLRRSEWVVAVFFCYATILAVSLPLRPSIPPLTLRMNTVVLGGLFLLAYAEALRHRIFLAVLRDWYPLALLLLAYREIGWFAPAVHNYSLEHAFEVWDKALLNQWGLKAVVESLGPVGPAILEIAYAVVYAIPAFALAMIYVYRRGKQAERLLFTVVLAVLTVYALLPWFPSEPPRTVFPGEDFPVYNTIFRRFNWWLLGGYGIHTGVFPSAHVAGAFSSALAIRPILAGRKWVSGFLLVLAILIAVATVYGRYHFAADAAAGLAVALAANTVAASALRRSI